MNKKIELMQNIYVEVENRDCGDYNSLSGYLTEESAQALYAKLMEFPEEEVKSLLLDLVYDLMSCKFREQKLELPDEYTPKLKALFQIERGEDRRQENSEDWHGFSQPDRRSGEERRNGH